ncbi:hypothetical protein TRIUR3_30839 [Triticum urartu]|uniref:Uncharacterized protein n=1 Tax=Triticum urartu TaxID=4572 RepID=M7YQ74_TRIUA|nr:hypothetical protein TRIUR3_30839 [Triticum urartu]
MASSGGTPLHVPWVAATVVLFLSLSVWNFRMGFRQGKGDPCEIERPGGASTNVGRRIAPVKEGREHWRKRQQDGFSKLSQMFEQLEDSYNHFSLALLHLDVNRLCKLY